MPRERDNQRLKLYRTEREVFHKNHGSFPVDFETAREVQQYVNKVTRSKFWKGMGGRQFVHARLVNGNRRYARGWSTRIELPPWAKSRIIILHELSHSLKESISGRSQSHGPEFVLIYRRLIEQEYGQEIRAEFDHAAERNHVRWGLNGNSAITRRFQRI